MSIVLEKRLKRKNTKAKHGTFIESFFMGFLLLFLVIFVLSNIPFKSLFSQRTISTSTVNVTIQDSDDYNLYYNQFWQKLNTVSALSADFNHDSSVSIIEMKLYRQKFFDANNMTDDGQYAYKDGEIVSPKVLLCLLNNYSSYKPKKNSKC